MPDDKLKSQDLLIYRFASPIIRFLRNVNLGSKLLFLATMIALIWANSPFAQSYFDLWNTDITLNIGSFVLSDTLGHWINDGLMVLFFFVIGLEIKRELLVGELSTFKKASLPLFAALGGIVFPALIYTFFNWQGPGAHGWGIPMATDIAFALGFLILLGDRIPLNLKVFLLALAIVDDLGAIMVIALFYTETIDINSLMIAILVLISSVFLNVRGVRSIFPYALLGIFLWVEFLQSGVHATIAGVLLAFTIPARANITSREFKIKSHEVLQTFSDREFKFMCTDEDQHQVIYDLKRYISKFETPLQKLEEKLHPLAVIFIIPLFALANAGISFAGMEAQNMLHPITLGIVGGLVVGKQLGIFLFSWLGVKMGFAFLPEGIGWWQIYGVSCLAGIGFTMSLFITNLAFINPEFIELAKIGILFASFISAVWGVVVLVKYSKS